MAEEAKAAGDKSHGKTTWELIGSRRWVSSSKDLEQPATSWPKEKLD